jgi:hypothetical protein
MSSKVAAWEETTVFWRKKKRVPEFGSVQLPGDVGHVSIPADFVVEMEDDSTLMAYPSGEETITLRFSSISFYKEGQEGTIEYVAVAVVRSKAAERGLSYAEIADKGIMSYQNESEQSGVFLLQHFWEVGSKNTVVVVSATIVKAQQRSKVVKSTLDAMPSILGSLEVTRSLRAIESGGKEVLFAVQTADPVPQSLRPFGEDDEKWLETALDQARELGLKYGTGGELTPEELDRVFSRWMAEGGEKESGDLVASALGAAFGAYFVEQHRFRWMVVTDQYGTDYAVQHYPGPTIAFPCSSVMKRIERGEPEFFQDIDLMILDQLKRAAEEDQQSR